MSTIEPRKNVSGVIKAFDKIAGTEELKDYEIVTKDNKCDFSYFNIYCQLFMTILLDNILYNVFISRYVIYIKNSVNNNILYIKKFYVKCQTIYE